MPSSATVDPAVIRFVEHISAGIPSIADSTAALLIRLAARVVKLEKSQAQQDAKLAKLTKSAVRPSTDKASLPLVETGVDVRDGAPVRHEIKIPLKRGRPKGRKDGYARRRRTPAERQQHDPEELRARFAANAQLLDPEWDS